MAGENGDWKAEQFERLWNGITAPHKLPNPVKAAKFRQYIREHVRQKVPDIKTVSRRRSEGFSAGGHIDESRYFTKEYCRKYWMGELQKEIREAESY